MKNNLILITLLSGLLLACDVQKKTRVNTNTETNTNLPIDEKSNIDENNNTDILQGGLMLIDGTVKNMKNHNGCGFLIETTSATGDTTYLEPLKLPENYRKEGIAIRFAFRYSRRPSSCTVAVPIIIDKVEA